MQWFVILTCLLPALLIPRWSRRGIYFGLTVPDGFAHTPEGQGIYRRYLLMQVGATLLGAAFTFANPMGSVVSIFLQLAAMFLGFAQARHQLEPFRQKPDLRREASLGQRSATRVPHPLFWVLGLMPLVLAALTIYGNWDIVPDPIPMHYDARGTVNRWVPKSPAAFFEIAIPALAVNIGLVLSAFFTARARRISLLGEAAASEQLRIERNLQLLLASQVFGNVVLAAVVLGMATLISKAWLLGGILGGTLVFVAATMWVTSRVSSSREASEPSTDGTDDRYWWLGMIYVNRQDSAVLVENRTGIGYTLNLANPASWLLLGVLMAPAALAIWIR